MELLDTPLPDAGRAAGRRARAGRRTRQLGRRRLGRARRRGHLPRLPRAPSAAPRDAGSPRSSPGPATGSTSSRSARSTATSSAPSPSSVRSCCGVPTAAGVSTSRARRPAPSTGGSRRSTPTGPRTCPPAAARSCSPATTQVAVKDPVITVRDGQWEMWLCEHPLTEPGDEDRMTTSYLTSADGLAWTRHGTVLEPTPRHLGRPRRPGDHRALPRPARGAVRRPPDRRGQLARDHLGRPGRRDRRAARRP